MNKKQVLDFLNRMGKVTITNVFKDDYFKYIELTLDIDGKATKYLEIISYMDEDDVTVEILRYKSNPEHICMNAYCYTLEDLYLEGLESY